MEHEKVDPRALMKQTHGQKKAEEEPTKIPMKAATSTTPSISSTPKDRAEVSANTSISQIARPELPVTTYGVKPVATSFNCYNKELFEWLRNFSSNNQFSGGVAITKSQLIEIALDVIMYDLAIKPIGYESQQALREDIQNKLKG